jgi:DNA polymerase-3 subunit epsilon
VKRILILDTETTGLDPRTDQVIEVAGLVYSVEHATTLAAFSSLVRADANAVEKINRIPPAALKRAPEAAMVWARLVAFADGCEAVVAHNAAFDHAFTPSGWLDALPWVCSKSDIEWPRQTRPEPSLVPLALEHDLGVAVAHRALADCDLIARLFTRSRELGADLDAMLARAMRPKADFVSLAPFERKEEVKAAGFHWVPERKEWRRRLFIEDAKLLPFPVRQVAA